MGLVMIQAQPLQAVASDPAALYLDSLTPGSRRTMAGCVRRVAELAGAPWHALGPQHTGAVRRALCDRYQPATVNLHLSALRGVLRACWRLGLVDADTYHRAADVANVRYSRRPAGRAVASAELRAAGAGAPERDRVLLLLLYGAGLRVAEACALDCGDIQDGVVHVRRGKGDKARSVPLPPWAVEAVGAHAAAPKNPATALLRSERGRLTPSGARYVLSQYGLRPHDLRRTYITRLLEAGADLLSVANLAGHANVNTTRRYDMREEQEKAAAAALLAEI